MVFDAVTTRTGFAAWWTKEVYVKAGEENKLRLHFGPAYFKELQKAPSEKNRKSVWKVVEAHPEWLDTELVFDLRQDEKGIKLFFEHNGWREYTDMFSQCSFDWTIFLRSLKSYCENGKGKPFPDYL